MDSSILEPGEDRSTTFRENMGDVEVFLGREFEDEPGLIIVPEQLDVPYTGKYVPKGHNIVHNPHGLVEDEYEVNERGVRGTDIDADRLSRGINSMQTKTEEDVLQEELFHAKMAEELGYSKPDYDEEDLEPQDFFTDPLGQNVPGYLIEGFADFCRSYLSDNRSLADTENIVGFYREKEKFSGNSSEQGLHNIVEAYVGHLLFRSINQQEPLDTTLEIALEDPSQWEDMSAVVQEIESGDVDYDERIWSYAKDHMQNYESEDPAKEFIDQLTNQL